MQVSFGTALAPSHIHLPQGARFPGGLGGLYGLIQSPTSGNNAGFCEQDQVLRL